MTIKDIDTSLFLFDPNSKGFLQKCEQHSELNLKTVKISSKKLLSYIALMCDKSSDIRKDRTLTYAQRKRKSAELVGFEITDGKFSEDVEHVLLGYNKDFNRAFVKYLSLQYDPEITWLAVLEVIQNRSYLTVLSSGDDKAIKTVQAASERIYELEQNLFGGEEKNKLMREELYAAVGAKQLNLKPEDYARRINEGETLSDDNPYGEDYIMDPLKFIDESAI